MLANKKAAETAVVNVLVQNLYEDMANTSSPADPTAAPTSAEVKFVAVEVMMVLFAAAHMLGFRLGGSMNS